MLPFLLLITTLGATAAPVITGWQNNYSFNLPGTPSYAVAQGAILVIYGSGMAPAGVLSQSFDPALNRNLGGVSIKITAGPTTTEAIPYYVSPTQIAAILPSATPVGNATMTVSYNGATSAPFALTVTQSAVGLLTLNGAGNGAAAVYDANYQYIGIRNAANPGQTVIFWGTGNGPDANDETRLITLPKSSATGNFEFYIGNKLATVAYHGRSSYPGLDQFNVVIPDGVSGCYVSAFVRTGTTVSNFVTIPVAQNGRTCSDVTGFGADEIDKLPTSGSINSATLYLGRYDGRIPAATVAGTPIAASTTLTDNAVVSLLRYSPFDYSNYGGIGTSSVGSCIVSSYRPSAIAGPTILKYLDAGAVSLQVPDGTTKAFTKGTNSYFLNGSKAENTLFLAEGGGSYRISATGGTDVGPFAVALNGSPALNWTNRDSIANVSRSQSLDLTWTGGATGGFVVITGSSILSAVTDPVVTIFNCTELVSAGHFTIPQAVLSAMVPSFVNPGSTIPTGNLQITNYNRLSRFSATGLDLGITGYFSGSTTLVNYQ
ncbi:hypothetical protein [Bryobacter aggregatus]|uniref:hypothetical protein n=1 Tax=Bryobacter aggregatus TaxID=360054 RepID=UPI0004E1CF62|nr:hypothetical protein [Bryobacter aggregatus]